MIIMQTLLLLLMSYLFLSAAAAKARNLSYSVQAVKDYQILPQWSAGLVLRLIIGAEAFSALAILWLPLREAAIALMSVLLLTYALAIAVNLMRGRKHLDCGCNGPANRERISWFMVLRNMCLLLLLNASGLAGLAFDSVSWLVAMALATFALLLYQGIAMLFKNQQALRALRKSE